MVQCWWGKGVSLWQRGTGMLPALIPRDGSEQKKLYATTVY